jgi:ceramide glucosyltransferase
VDARVVFSGEPPEGRTGKLNAMIAGLEVAKGELIAFADSDIRPDGHALARLVETLLANPRNGAAFSPVVAVLEPETAGDAGYALLLNAMYSPAAAAATRKNGGELPFIMGQFMLFTREAIRRIGGLQTAEGQLVDDMYLGARLREEGLRNAVSPHRVPIIQAGMSLNSFLKTFLRWITFSRSGLPGKDFKLASYLRAATYWAGLVLAVLAASAGLWTAAAVGVLAPAAVALSNNRLHRAMGGGRLGVRYAWVSFALLLTAPFVLLSVLTRREVTWRGRSYKLNASSRLAAEAVCLENCEQPV